MSRNDLQQLIDHSLGLVEVLLIKQEGEFFPFGAAVNNEGELSSVGSYDGDERPASEKVIDDLRHYFEVEFSKNVIRGYSIAYDCLAQRNPESEKSDAVAIECYPVDDQRVTYYYPYKVTHAILVEFGEAWGIVNE